MKCQNLSSEKNKKEYHQFIADEFSKRELKIEFIYARPLGKPFKQYHNNPKYYTTITAHYT